MIYRFSDFELDADTRELHNNGERVDTEPKAFELLLYLLQNRDRAVSKDELQNTLWPRSIVTETALTRCVMKARRAVNDDANSQAVIRTLHGHGYRFVAEIDAGTSSPAPALEPDITPAPPKSQKRGNALAVACMLLVIGAVAIYGLNKPGNPAKGALAVLPVINQIDDQELSWISLGLMSLMNRMLVDTGVPIVKERTVVRVSKERLGEDGGFRREQTEQLANALGAARILSTNLRKEGGLYRLEAELTEADGTRVQRVLVGDSPAALAADASRVITGLVGGSGRLPERRMSRVSTDPFVNEAYGRALSLELQGKLEQARDLFRVAAQQDPELFWLRYEIALCTRDLREWDEAERMLGELFEEASAANDTAAMVATLNSNGVMYIIRHDYDAARKPLEQALSLIGDSPFSSDRSTVHTNMGLIEKYSDNLARAEYHFDQAILAYAEEEDSAPPNFLNNYAGIKIAKGQLAEAQELSEQAVAAYKLRGSRRYEASALNRLGKILRRQGKIDEAELRHQQSVAINRELNNEEGELISLSGLTSVYRDRGDLTRARRNAEDIRRRALAIDSPLVAADSLMFLGMIAMEARDFAEASQHFTEARRAFVESGDLSTARQADQLLIRAQLEHGQLAPAEQLARQLLSAADADNNDKARGSAQQLLARIDFARGNSDSAETLLSEALKNAQSRKDERQSASIARQLAEMYAQQCQTEPAEAALAC
ncbi:MAG: tetratricopeptide repeat protein [Pseudomonadota bacterium]